MEEESKHIHFDWGKDFDAFEEICRYSERDSCRGISTKGLWFAEGKIVGCNEERSAVFKGFIQVAFEAGIMYGIRNKDKIKPRECSDSKCSKYNPKDNTKGLYV